MGEEETLVNKSLAALNAEQLGICTKVYPNVRNLMIIQAVRDEIQSDAAYFLLVMADSSSTLLHTLIHLGEILVTLTCWWRYPTLQAVIAVPLWMVCRPSCSILTRCNVMDKLGLA